MLRSNIITKFFSSSSRTRFNNSFVFKQQENLNMSSSATSSAAASQQQQQQQQQVGSDMTTTTTTTTNADGITVSSQRATFGADGWFHEESVCWPGQALSLKVKQVKLDKQTRYQHLTVFENDGPWGNVLTLDGAIQLTDKDEFVYHESMAHVPLFAHANPKQVLIIGGGDGGVMREVCKHDSVDKCTLVDIDGDVMEASKQFFPQIGVGFAHRKAEAIVGDGAAFVRNAAAASYDVVIVDSSDPEGPASSLFGTEFYSQLLRILRPGGILCAQGECMWLHAALIKNMMNMMRSVGFADVKYSLIYIPTYPCGSIGSLIGVKANNNNNNNNNENGEDNDESQEVVRGSVPRSGMAPLSFPDVSVPARTADIEAMDLKYYNAQMHSAAFILPNFAAKMFSVDTSLPSSTGGGGANNSAGGGAFAGGAE